jgi:hypothetical protein
MTQALANSETASFVVSGPAFIRALMNLKPAYPKKKQATTAVVGIVATTTNEVSIQLAGASAKLPAIVSKPLTFQIRRTSLKSNQILFRAEKIEIKNTAGSAKLCRIGNHPAHETSR